jgi:hypothetical protein
MEVCVPLKDPDSGNLDRIQIIKGYLGGRFGDQQETIYDVALSDGRKPDPKTGNVPPVGNTVDVKKVTYTNDIGDSQLSAVWTDPDFDPTQPAVYYVRVPTLLAFRVGLFLLQNVDSRARSTT